ncbi:GDSL esterase/lipase At5g03610-like [Rutidosis leptorrhynchoides]|uniref:GDSL esterase/lipase At5g03610-like n=1 Tax=Rutidosis leptorrhynchoides TaxID=125765 RepID=UPI003A996078
MEIYGLPSYIFCILFTFYFTGVTVWANDPNCNSVGEFKPTKLFVFGDSYSDTGNNPRALASSWKTPYGHTFPGKPAGRYSDGRVLTDYLARFMGLKSPLPHQMMKYGKDKLKYGMNFAYGGTGVFDTGNLQPNMTSQIGFLQNLLHENVYTKRDLESSLALVTVSGNDYGAYTSSGGSELGLPVFIASVVKQMAINLKAIHDLGVRRVLVNMLQPLGCLPQSTILNSYQECNDSQNTAVGIHNQLLQQAVSKLNNDTKNSSFLMLDLYSAFDTVLKNKGNSKFDTPLKSCCVATKSGANCGSVDDNGNPLYTVCNDTESMFFWDTVHPTQAGWRAVFLTLRSSLNQIYI